MPSRTPTIADPLVAMAYGAGRWFDESMAVVRACWTGRPVVHEGERYHLDGVAVKPVPDRMEVWLGGIAPSELRRVGRLADGRLPSFVTPADAATGPATPPRSYRRVGSSWPR